MFLPESLPQWTCRTRQLDQWPRELCLQFFPIAGFCSVRI
jgi:hypothetical protein